MNTQKEIEDVRRGLPSASGIHRLINCPASWLREKDLPDVPSEVAEKGTRIHKYLEDASSIALEEDELEIALACKEVEEYVIEEWGYAPVHCEREKRLWLNYLFADVMSGSADAIYCDGDGHYLVVDYKTGRGQVSEPNSNYQLAALAVLLSSAVANYKTIHCAIVQPLVSHKPGLASYDYRDIDDMEAYIIRAVTAAQSKYCKASPSESSCKYCKAFATCPDAHKSTELALRTDIAVSRWEDYTSAQKLECYELAKLAAKWAGVVEGRIKDDLLTGIAIEGLALKAGAGKRTVTDADGCFASLPMLTSKEFVSCCTVKISDLEAAFYRAEQTKDKEAGVKPRTQKALKKELAELIGETISIKQSKPSVERIS